MTKPGRGAWAELALRLVLVVAVFALAGVVYLVFRHVDARQEADLVAARTMTLLDKQHHGDFPGWARAAALLRASPDAGEAEVRAAEQALLDRLESAYLSAPSAGPPLDKPTARFACERLGAVLAVFEPPPQTPPRPWETDGHGLAAARAGCAALRGERVVVPGLLRQVEEVQQRAEELRDGS